MQDIPRLGRSHGEGKGNLLQYSCLDDPMDRGVWWATVHGVAKELDMTWLTTAISILVQLESISTNPGKEIYFVVKFCNLLLGYSGFFNEYAPIYN